MSVQNGHAATEDLSQYLKTFDKTLDDMLSGQRKCSLQLRDLTLFKTIKHKIENYPILNELYDRLETRSSVNRLRESLSQQVISNPGSRPMSGLSRNDRSTASLRGPFQTLKDGGYGTQSRASFLPGDPSEISAGVGAAQAAKPNSSFIFASASPYTLQSGQNDILLTALDFKTLINEAVDEAKRVLKLFRKIKIATFSSYFEKQALLQHLKQTFWELFLGNDSGYMYIRENGLTKSECNVGQPFTLKNLTTLNILLKNEKTTGIRDYVCVVDDERQPFKLVTIAKGTTLYHFTAPSDSNKLFDVLIRGMQDENATVHNFLVDSCEAIRAYEENDKADQYHEYEQFLMIHKLDLTVHKVLPTLLILILQGKTGGPIGGSTTPTGGKRSNPGSDRIISDNPGRKTQNTVMQKVRFHVEGSKIFENIRLETDMFFREDSTQYIMLTHLGLCVELPVSNNVFPSEIRTAVLETVGSFNSWIQCSTRYLVGQTAYRERETMRLVFHFDDDRHLFDQSGRKKLVQPHSFNNIASLAKEVKLAHLFQEGEDSKLAEAAIEDMRSRGTGSLSAQSVSQTMIGNFKVEFIPEVGSARAFYMVFHRVEKYSLPYICAKRLLSGDEVGKSIIFRRTPSDMFSSSVVESIIKAKSLRDSVAGFKKYLQEEHRLSDDNISALFVHKQEKQAEQILEKNPDMLLSNIAEYFTEVRKPAPVLTKLKARVHAEIFNKRMSMTSKIISSMKKEGPASRPASPVSKYESPEYLADLKFLKTPDADFLDCQNQQMYTYAWTMFRDIGAVEEFSISETRFYILLNEVQRLYDHRSNPFHNFKHGISVLQSTYFILKMTKVGEVFDRLGLTALVFAAMMHDIDHSGKTNGFEVNSGSDLAVRYNDVSVLENHHCATAFGLVRQERYNIFSKITAFDVKNKFRKIVVNGILSTDVKSHFSHLEKFKDKLITNNFNPTTSEDDMMLLVGQIVHTSDLYVPTKQPKAAYRWSQLINQEFMNQNQAEKSNGLPETPFYKNLDKPEVVAKSERFFVEKIVQPLWVEMDRFAEGALETQLDHLKQNIAFWDKELKRIDDEKTSSAQKN